MALDTKALRRSDMILCHNIPTHDENIEPAFFSRLMLRDPLHRINTIGFGHGKRSPYQQRVRALDCYRCP
jgi:hypothetical protein